VSALRPPPHNTVVFVFGERITRGDIPGLCERVRWLLERSDADLLVCDVELVRPNADAIDALARLQLTARRLGCRLRLRNASIGLRELLVLAGLAGIVRPCAGLSIESRRQAEEREHGSGVEEEGDPADPVA